MNAAPTPAHQFWDHYFGNRFVTLERSADRYDGLVYADAAKAGPPASLLGVREPVPFVISFEELGQYDYAQDPRFTLLEQRPRDPAFAYDAVIAQTYPYRDRAPFGKLRMAELFASLRDRITLPGEPISVAAVERMTLDLTAEYTDSSNHPLAALAWFLGEFRQPSSAPVLVGIVANAAFIPSARHRIHFTSVDAAFSALWKVDDKMSLKPMVELMFAATDTGRRKIAALFERLLSTRHLLSSEYCAEKYFDPGYWTELLGARTTDIEWFVYDLNSLFWEIRYLAGSRLRPMHSAALQKLVSDEVATVRAVVLQPSGRTSDA